MKRKWNDLYLPAQIWSPNTESIQNNGHWIDLIDEDTLTGLRSCAIIQVWFYSDEHNFVESFNFQIIFGLLLFIRWLWKRNCPEVTEEVTRQVVPVGTETRTVIGEQGSQVVGVQQVNTIYAATQNVTQVLTYDKPSWTYVFVNFIILLSGTCGILSLYYDMSTLNEEPIWLFRIFQVFISLSLAILIPVSYHDQITHFRITLSDDVLIPKSII